MKLLFQEASHAEQLYRLIIDSALDAFVAIDADSIILEWSEQAAQIFGWQKGEVIGKSLADTIIPERYRAAHLNGVRRYLKSGVGPIVNKRVEMAARRKDGAEIPVELSVTPIKMGSRTILSATLRDISQRKSLDEALRRQVSITTSILDSMADAVVVATPDERLVVINPAGQRLLNVQPPGPEGAPLLNMFELLLEDGKTACPDEMRPIRRALRGEHVDDFIGLIRHAGQPNGVWVSASARPLVNGGDKPVGGVVVFHDITQQVETERALKRSQEDFRLLVEASTDHAIMMIDPAGAIQSWNTGAERILGYSAEQAIGRSVDELFTSEDRSGGEPRRELEEARLTGRAEDDRWHVRRDGSRFWATGVVTPLWQPEGRLRGYVKIMRDQTAQRLADEQTQFLANHDALTGLPNRVSFSNQLHQSIAMSQRSNLPLALLLLDLDRFKHVNDTFGHHTGDLLLREVALRILSSIRETDFVARLGGDEFVIIQADVSQPEAAETLARKLVLELGRPYELEGQEVHSGTSIGLCTYPRDGRNPVELLKRADLALYRAKHFGRHTFQFYTDDLVSELSWRKDREAALRGALRNREFELYYQPQINLASWKVSAVEALLRWNAGDMQTVLPKDFLDIAEQTGLIVEIGEWALRRASRQLRRWQAQGLGDLRLSINCSARQFSDPKFVAAIPAILEEAGIALSSLELEVPEAMLAEHPEIKSSMSELRSLGIRLTIDNFGTGATALIDFTDFAIDMLKIDKAFVQHLPHRREDSAITSAIISLAHNLGVGVSAGGVETAEQLAYLKARDCTSAQGFIFSPPVPAAMFEEMMRNGSWSRMNPGVQ